MTAPRRCARCGQNMASSVEAYHPVCREAALAENKHSTPALRGVRDTTVANSRFAELMGERKFTDQPLRGKK